MHDVRVALHPEVVVTVKVNVARSAEEAEIQARGGTILAAGEEPAEEAPLPPEAVFEAGAPAPSEAGDEKQPDGGAA